MDPQHEASFLVLLDGVRGDVSSKNLAAQLIPKHAGGFPLLGDTALHAMIDLCEEQNNLVRLYAIRGLAGLAKHSAEQGAKVVDVLAQLLLSGE